MRYYVLTPDGKNREITPEQYERLEMDNRNGWGDFIDKIDERVQKTVDRIDGRIQEAVEKAYDHFPPQSTQEAVKKLEVDFITDKKFQISSDEDFLDFIKNDGVVHNGQNREVRGLKHDFSKPQMGLLPLKDLEGVVRVLEFGAKKYARGDWAFVDEGGPRYLDACIRHIGAVIGTGGLESLKSTDLESGLPHIDHAICSLIFARHFIFKDQVEINDK